MASPVETVHCVHARVRLHAAMADDDQYLSPDYSMIYNPKKHTVDVKINLHKIPEKFINFDPNSTHLILNTDGFTKKLRLNVPYPNNRTVDTRHEVEAALEFGILKCSLPVTGAKPTEGVVKKRPLEKQQNSPADPKQKKAKTSSAAGPSKQTEAKSKAPALPQKEKAVKRKKGKKFLEDKSAAMSLVDALNDEEDRTREKKLQKESEKVNFLQHKEQKKKAQKQKKEELRKVALKELEEKQKIENAPARAPTPRKISFGESSSAKKPGTVVKLESKHTEKNSRAKKKKNKKKVPEEKKTKTA